MHRFGGTLGHRTEKRSLERIARRLESHRQIAQIHLAQHPLENRSIQSGHILKGEHLLAYLLTELRIAFLDVHQERLGHVFIERVQQVGSALQAPGLIEGARVLVTELAIELFDHLLDNFDRGRRQSSQSLNDLIPQIAAEHDQ